MNMYLYLIIAVLVLDVKNLMFILCCSLWRKYFRGGASEASVATLTGDVDGSSRYMYDTCVKPLGQLLHAHAQMLLSQQFSKFIFTGKGNSGKKDLLL